MSSSQFQALRRGFENHEILLGQLSSTSVIRLFNSENDEEGVRVELDYLLRRPPPGVETGRFRVTVQAFYLGSGQETAAYVRYGSFLFEEYLTDGLLLKEWPGYVRYAWEGAIILGLREFESRRKI